MVTQIKLVVVFVCSKEREDVPFWNGGELWWWGRGGGGYDNPLRSRCNYTDKIVPLTITHRLNLQETFMVGQGLCKASRKD